MDDKDDVGRFRFLKFVPFLLTNVNIRPPPHLPCESETSMRTRNRGLMTGRWTSSSCLLWLMMCSNKRSCCNRNLSCAATFIVHHEQKLSKSSVSSMYCRIGPGDKKYRHHFCSTSECMKMCNPYYHYCS